MAENRKMVYIGLANYNDFSLGMNLDFDWKVKRIRNEIRTALDPLLNHNEWLVSDIFCNFASDHRTAGFIIRHMSAGTPTGHEWLFVFYQAQSDHLARLAINSSTAYWRRSDNYSTTLDNRVGFFMQYNPYSGIDPTGANGHRYNIGWDDFSEASYALSSVHFTGTDTFTPDETIEIEQPPGGVWATGVYKYNLGGRIYFASPSGTGYLRGGLIKDQATGLKFVNIANSIGSKGYGPIEHHGDFVDSQTNGGSNFKTQHAAFMPTNHSEIPRGYSMNGYWEANPGGMSILFDHNKPFLMFYDSNAQDMYSRYLVLCGSIIEPYFPGGNRNACFHFKVRVDGDEGGVEEGDVLEGFYDDYLGGGGRVDWTKTIHGNFGRGNSPRVSDKKYPWDIVRLSNSNEIKGHVDTDIIRILGPYEWLYDRVFEGPDGPFIKKHQYLCFPWVTGQAPTPSPTPWGVNGNMAAGEILDELDY